MNEERFQKLISCFDCIELSDKEKDYLKWLSGWDDETETVFVSLFQKLKAKKEGD